MVFDPFTKTGKDCFDRYLFYRGLGYSVPAAEVLSRLTYGSFEALSLARRFRAEKRLVRMYARMQVSGRAEPEPEPDPDTEYAFMQDNLAFCGASPTGEPAEAANFDPFDAVDADAADFGPAPKRRSVMRSKKLSAFLDSTEPEPDGAFAEGCACPMIAPGDVCFSVSDMSSDAYEPIEEKGARGVFTAPASTFRMTTGTASMGILFNQLRSGRRINMDQVRIEELLNAFDYASEIPTDAIFAIHTEPMPKTESKKLLYINVQACEERREHQNIIVLLDVSGSMCRNAEVTQATVATVLSKLHTGDTFSLVTYSTKDHTVIDGYRIHGDEDKEILMGLLLDIEIGGCTHGSAGIKTAYRLGAKYYQEGWSNQVILITDGDLNFGITDKGGLRELIEKEKRRGLFLSLIGTGLWNYKDDNLEVLAKHGNGTYCVVNDLKDVEESIDRRYIALTNIVAKDVKAQVKFNPRLVKSYRLLGYENREISHEAFVDDTVISEPYGSGGHGVALYELEMGDGSARSGLKYQTPLLTDSEELCTVKVRYKEPLADVSHEIERVVFNQDTSTKNAELAWFIYCVSAKLRGSDKLDEVDEAWLREMVTGGKYKNLTEHDVEKLTLFVETMLLNLR